jgi:putative adhesin
MTPNQIPQEGPVPTFDTPAPISATIDIVGGDVRIGAGERGTTTVTVAPTDADNAEDRKAAEQTRVEYDGGRLLVKQPKLRAWLPRNNGGQIDVTVELPAGSHVHGDAALADFQTDGPIGQLRIKTGLGQIRVEQAETLALKSGLGDITVERATGHADVAAGSGDVRVRELASTAVIKNSNGDTWVGDAQGELRVHAANGDIAVEHAEAGVGAKSSNGDVRLGDVARGSVVLETSLGNLEVGIREGTAAWVDVRASAGRVLNELEAAEAPAPSTEKVEVRARTSAGDVVIRRS